MAKWRWMPGMTDTNGTTVTYVCGDGCIEGYNGQMVVVDDDCTPDWNDPATKGCLLEQVRRRHGAECSTEYRTGEGWRVFRPVGEEAIVNITGWHELEADAMLAALREDHDDVDTRYEDEEWIPHHSR